MKKVALLLAGLSVGFTGCFGYQPLYSQKHVDFSNVYVSSVTSQQEELVGKGMRRVAQIANRKLKEVFTAHQAPLALRVSIFEEDKALAVDRDATEERIELISKVDMHLTDVDTKKEVFKTSFEISTYYNVQDTPFATESGLERARESAAEGAAEEVLHRIVMFLNNHGK